MTEKLGRIGIVGAGAMGRGIAQVCASAGCVVRLFDTAADAVSRAIASVREDLAQAVARGKLAQAQADAALERIRPVHDLREFGDCDLVVKAIVEQLEAKQRLMRELEAVVTPQCIIATNTSSLSVTAIASACARPDRV